MKQRDVRTEPVLLQANTIFETFRAFTPGQLHFLGDNGLKVVTTCSDHPGAEAFFEKQGAVFYPLRMSRDISLVKDLLSLLSVIVLLRKVRPDVLQGSTPKAAFLFLTAGWLMRVPSRIFFMRGVRSSGLTGFRKFVVKMMEKISCAAAHRVLCTSPSVRDEIVRDGICPPGKAAVLANGTGNGIDTDFFSREAVPQVERERVRNELNIPPDARVVLFVGRIVRDKGVVELAGAWETVASAYPDAVLVMVGKRETEDPVPDNILTRLESDASVRMVGGTQDTRRYFAAADIFVLPTYREGIPIALLEASSMSLPVVATRVTGCIDALLDGITGRFVPARDIADLARAIGAYLENPEMRLLHGEAGRSMVIERFARRRVWSALLREYQLIMSHQH